MQAVLSKHCDSFPNPMFAHGGIRDDEYLRLQILGIAKIGLGRMDQIGLPGGVLVRLFKSTPYVEVARVIRAGNQWKLSVAACKTRPINIQDQDFQQFLCGSC